MKEKSIARNHSNHYLVFNAIVPGSTLIQVFKENCSVHFGKVPNLSYLNKLGKHIPMIWKFLFKSVLDLEFFYDLLLTCFTLAKAVNDSFHSIPFVLTQHSNLPNDLNESSVNLLEEDNRNIS